jgi:predicted amidohydrolase
MVPSPRTRGILVLALAAFTFSAWGVSYSAEGPFSGGEPDIALGANSKAAERNLVHDWPEGWSREPVRKELSPEFGIEALGVQGFVGEPYLVLEGRGRTGEDGRWTKAVAVRAGKHYLFETAYEAERIRTPRRCVLARVVWRDSRGSRIAQPEYPETSPAPSDDGWTAIRGVYRAPEGAVEAVLELHLRWAPQGKVSWRRVRFEEVPPPPSRKIKLASVNHRPRGSTPARNLERFGALVEEAASKGADFVCLPEGITVVGTGKTYLEVAEPVPGPSTEHLGKIAAGRKVHVAAGLYERDGEAVYNTCVLIGPDGRLLGKYRKVCLPREEIDGGIAPGEDYPVFDVGSCRVGLMICWDVHFPEVARRLAEKGAEIIFLPIWGGNETLARARAIENQVWLVASGYDFRTAIIDRKGEFLARASSDPEVIVSDVDLGEREIWPWLGDFRARIWREAPEEPGTAGPGVEAKAETGRRRP